jgi:biopolymer transport protein ExbD
MAERREVRAPEKVDIQMTPMIDIVFQLMAFFLMTFKVATVEGDFDLKLPKPDRTASGPKLRERIIVRLEADAGGDLASLRIQSGPPLAAGRGATSPFRALASHLDRRSAEARAAGQEEPEIELDADDVLRYEHIVATFEAVRGRPDPTNQPDRPAARSIRFTPRRE